MSNEAIELTPEQAASNEAFLKERRESGVEYRIKRHSKAAKITHGVTAISCILLCISGLFVFIAPLGQAIGSDAVFVIRMLHRIIGCVFVVVPIVSAIKAPKSAKHTITSKFDPWTSDDKKWMILFLPYMFLAKWTHMPDQDEVKSGQRFADGALLFFCILMGVTGVLLVIGSSFISLGGAYGVILFLHDLGFLLICVFGMAHIFMGAGIFQPYRGMHKAMFGDGAVSESDSLYHWAHWARKEMTTRENVIEAGDKPAAATATAAAEE